MMDVEIIIRANGGVTLSDIAKLVGEDAAMRIAVSFAGMRLNIPSRRITASHLCRVLGEEAAGVICATWPGAILDVPVKAARDVRIHRMHRDGVSLRKIAHSIPVSVTTVKRALKRNPWEGELSAPANANQLDLFV